MGAMGTGAVTGPQSAPVIGQGLPVNTSMAVFTSTMSASYSTGGDTITLPADVHGDIVAVNVMSCGTDFANRTYMWNGQAGSSAKVVALDAFKTEEGAATDLSAVTVTLLVFLES